MFDIDLSIKNSDSLNLISYKSDNILFIKNLY